MHHGTEQLLRNRIAELELQVQSLTNQRELWSMASFGVPGLGVANDTLMRTSNPVDLLVIDVRKLHELNYDDVLSYSGATLAVRKVLLGRDGMGRRQDGVFQMGGDEFLIVVPSGDGQGRLRRLLECAEQVSNEMTAAQRSNLARHTEGLVDRLCLAVVLVENSVFPLDDINIALDAVVRLKTGGTITSNRATSGAAGTLTMQLTEKRAG